MPPSSPGMLVRCWQPRSCAALPFMGRHQALRQRSVALAMRGVARLPADARPGCCVVRLDSWFASARSWVQFPEHPLPGETLSSRTAMAGEGELLGAGLACQRKMMAARPGSAYSAQHVCTGASTRGSWSGALAKRPAPPTATSPGRTLCMGWSLTPVCTQSAAQSLLV